MSDENNTVLTESVNICAEVTEEVVSLVNQLEDGDITAEEAVKVVEYNYRAPNIKMPPEFFEQGADERARYMHKLANAMNHAAKLLQDERNALLKKLEVANKSVANAETQVMIQKAISANALNQLNTEKQENAIRTGALQTKIKNLETVLKASGLKLD